MGENATVKELFGRREEIIIKERPQHESGKRGLSIKVESCLVAMPVEIRLPGNRQNGRRAFIRPRRLECCNVGRIESVCDPISDVSVGDKVVSSVMAGTDRFYIARDKIVKIPKRLVPDEACFIGLGAMVFYSVRKAGVELGHKVLVIGQGLEGQLAARIARLAGADVLGLDVDVLRLKIAETGGIKTMRLTETGVSDHVLDFSNGVGADVVFVCCIIGAVELWEHIWRMVRPDGKVVLMCPQMLRLCYDVLCQKNLSIWVCVGHKMWNDYFWDREIIVPMSYVRWDQTKDMAEVRDMLSDGRLSVFQLITHRFHVERNKPPSSLTLKPDSGAVAVLLNFT